jgi:Na+/H+ antiporter NhaD/arsenite permease-like protein
MAEPDADGRGFHGPLCWLVTAVVGLLVGSTLALVIPGDAANHAPVIPLWLVAPFALLLASIALMPFIHAGFWHRHYPDFAFFLGGLIAGYYLLAYRGTEASHEASHDLLHAVTEYYAFIALVGGLFVVSGGILVDLRGRGTPALNTLLLLAGSVLANLVGTTGASMLLIRPFMRVNRGRLRPLHIVLFILIVSNGAGCLTPIGDPPLYLGFLKGVPFFWTLEHLWPDWILVVGLLLAVFYVYDAIVERRQQRTFSPLPTSEEAADLMERQLRSRYGLAISGVGGLVCLALMIAGVFVDPILHRFAKVEGIPVGATLQLLVALTAYLTAPRAILASNDFNFGPVKEVGLLFLGIFVTMVPALSYLGEHGHSFGINSPSAFYYGTGFLSAVLDNAPTYANFLQIALGPKPITPESLRDFLATPDGVIVLDAISTAAVFFGAMTYIGNGPNFMVKAIAESSGVAMPSFFGYLLRAVVILLPVLVIHWIVFIR